MNEKRVLQCPLAPVVIANANGFRHVVDKNLAVPDFAGARAGHHGADHFVGAGCRNHHLHLHFGQQIHLVFHAAVDLFVTFLAAVPPYFGDGHPVDADGLQRLLDVFQFVGLDDCFDFFHGWCVVSRAYVSRLYPSSPCMLTSSPSSSCSGGTRTPSRASHIFRMIKAPTIARAQDINTPMAWFKPCPPLPSTIPNGNSLPAESFNPSLTALVAKTPVRRAPRVPPAPCTPNASRVSSYPNLLFTAVTMKKHTTPAANPISMAGNGFTNPDAGVTATNPATAPEIAPNMLGLPFLIHSANIHPSAAAAVA